MWCKIRGAEVDYFPARIGHNLALGLAAAVGEAKQRRLFSIWHTPAQLRNCNLDGDQFPTGRELGRHVRTVENSATRDTPLHAQSSETRRGSRFMCNPASPRSFAAQLVATAATWRMHMALICGVRPHQSLWVLASTRFRPLNADANAMIHLIYPLTIASGRVLRHANGPPLSTGKPCCCRHVVWPWLLKRIL